MVVGVDCITNIDLPTAKRLKDAGYSFVARYLYTDPSAYKTLKSGEVAAMTAAGLKILCVWETYESRINEGFAAGELDGNRASALAEKLGMPKSGCIYYACDYQPMSENELLGIENYLKGARRGSNGYRVGIYGSYSVCKRMKEAGLVDCVWQCVAWSGGMHYELRNVYQEGAGRMIYDEHGAILEVDPDILYTSFAEAGMWNLEDTDEGRPSNNPEVVEFTYENFVAFMNQYNAVSTSRESKPGDWDYDAVQNAKRKGLMVGYPDGKFKPDAYVTRSELATVLSRLEDCETDEV